MGGGLKGQAVVTSSESLVVVADIHAKLRVAVAEVVEKGVPVGLGVAWCMYITNKDATLGELQCEGTDTVVRGAGVGDRSHVESTSPDAGKVSGGGVVVDIAKVTHASSKGTVDVVRRSSFL